MTTDIFAAKNHTTQTTLPTAPAVPSVASVEALSVAIPRKGVRTRTAPICLSVVAPPLSDEEVAQRFTRATEILLAVDARCRAQERWEAMNLGSQNNGDISNLENIHK